MVVVLPYEDCPRCGVVFSNGVLGLNSGVSVRDGDSR